MFVSGYLAAAADTGAAPARTMPRQTQDLAPLAPSADDWPWWRGPNRDNIAADGQDPPVRWTRTENVLWKAEVPGRGHGSPCLWGEHVFAPTADDQAQIQYLLCYDRRTGQQRWQTAVHRQGFARQHSKGSHASATPACDGQRVFMPFVIQDAIWLSALDFEGKIVWQRRLGDFHSMHGFAASPLIYKSLVIVAADHLKQSFLVAVHRGTGEVVWKIDRPSYRLGTYASPTIGLVAGRDQLLHHGPMKVFSYAPDTGGLLWTCDGPSESSASTVCLGADRVYSTVGFPKRNFLCIRADGSGDVTKTHVAWSKKDKMPYVPSPLLADGLLYMVEEKGSLYCFEANTGEVVWAEKLEGAFSSSPVLAAGKIYVVNEEGTAFVFKHGRTFQPLASNELGDGGYATPVICAGRIYLRTFHNLYCLGKAP